MTEWSAGDTVGLDRVLYRDGRAVGMLASPEIALEIVAAMRVVERLLGPEPESGRERSPEVITRTEHDRIEEQLRKRSHAEQAAGGRVCGCDLCRSKRGEHLP